MTKEGKFAPILDTKVDLKKINLDIITKWIQAKITEILGFEDEIIINLVINMLMGEVQKQFLMSRFPFNIIYIYFRQKIEGKMLQLNVTGFLEKQAGALCMELWTL